jgi:hypothetical protein
MVFSLPGLLPICTAVLLLAQASPDPNAAYRHVGPTPPPHGYPIIKSMSLSTTDIHAGGPVNGTVETSPNVLYVEARINYRNVALHEQAPGKFSLRYTVPWWLPPWLRHDYTLEFVARTVDGVEAWRGIPIHVH